MTFWGKEEGGKYIKEYKISLWLCNSYQIGKDSLVAGLRHSGEEYCFFNAQDSAYSITSGKKSLFTHTYTVLQIKNNELLGKVLFNKKWFDGINGIVKYSNGATYEFKEKSEFKSIIRSNPVFSLNSEENFQLDLFSEENKISYISEFKLEKPGRADVRGSILITGNPPELLTLIGLFILDKKFSRWQQKNND